MSETLSKIIKFGIGLILFIPLYVGGSFYFPFIFPKIWVFQLVIELLALLYLILAISDARFRPRWNIVLWAVSTLTAVLIITSFTGIDVFRSFWGNTERMSGIIAWFHFVAFAIILSGILKTGKDWRNFFGIAVVVSILEFFYVLAQYAGLSWVWLPGNNVGTVGNADLLGTYAIFNAFFALHLWNNPNLQIDLNDANKGQSGYSDNIPQYSNYSWLWASAFFANILTLYFAGSRGAILGFLAGIFILILLKAWRRPQYRKTAVLVVLVLLGAYGLVFSLRDTDSIKHNYQLNRITHISLQDQTVQQRLTEWGIAWDAFKARPIFGFGPNNYLYIHNSFLNPLVYNLKETNFDRAHNAYLDYASMSGILGLLSYIFLIIVLFWTFWRNKLWSWVALVVAYAVQSIFVFDSPASYITLFLTIGFASFIANQEAIIKNKEPLSHGAKVSPQIVAVISILYFIFTVYIIWQVSWKPVYANLTFTSAFTGINSGALTPEQAFQNYQEALKYETLGTTEFRNQYSQWLQADLNHFPAQERLSVVDYGITQLEQEVKDHPSVFAYMNLGQIYYFEGNGFSQDSAMRQEDFQKAAQAYEKGLELSPKRLEVYYSYLQLAITAKDYNRGIAVMEKAVAAAPDYPTNWWYLGIANIAGGHNDDAIRAINKALMGFYVAPITEKDGALVYDLDQVVKDGLKGATIPPNQEILGVVNSYINTKKWNELLLLYLIAEMNNEKDVKIHESLALVYQNLGLTARAQEELKIVDVLQKQSQQQ